MTRDGMDRRFWWVSLTDCCTLPECIKWHGAYMFQTLSGIIAGCSKRPDFSPTQPRRAETRRSAGKAQRVKAEA